MIADVDVQKLRDIRSQLPSNSGDPVVVSKCLNDLLGALIGAAERENRKLDDSVPD